MDNLPSPNANGPAVKFEIEFGAPPLYINPYLCPPTESEHTLEFNPTERAIIALDCTIHHTKWPAFHWDVNALKSYARDWAGSESEMAFDVGANPDLFLESSVCDLDPDGERLVGPLDPNGLSGNDESNSVLVAPAPAPPVVDDSDKFSDDVNANAETKEIISDDAKGEDIPRYGTPDFKILRSSPSSSNPPNNTPIPTNISLPPSRSGSEDSCSESSESVPYGADWYFDFTIDTEWYLFHLFPTFNRASFSFETELEPELTSIEIEEFEMKTLLGSSLMALLDFDECFGQDEEVLAQMTEECLDVESDDEGSPVVVYSTSGHEAVSASGIALSPRARFNSLNVDVTPVEEPTKTPIDPIKLSKLSQLSTIPVAGDPSLLLLSTLPNPPFPESQPSDPVTNTAPGSPTQPHIFKKDPEPCTKLQIMDTQGTIMNEVEAQLGCGCDECRPFAMKALFGDWDWPWDGV